MCRFFVLLSLLLLSLYSLSAVTVTGKVVDTDGKPLNGVDVLLSFAREQKTLELKTDAAGSFSAEVTYDPDSAEVSAYAPGFTLTGASCKANGNVLTLERGATVRGTVVDAAGKPVAGVAVSLLTAWNARNYAMMFDGWRARFTVVTAADGGWTLPGAPRNGRATVGIIDPRYVHDQRAITLAGGKQIIPACFIVRAGASVSGRIFTSQGIPAADARVRVSSQGNNRMLARRGYDDSGRQLPHLRVGDGQI